MPLCTSVYMCLVVTCWERADLLALVYGVLLSVCYFPIGILGQVWYFIVSIPDLCHLTYLIEQLVSEIFMFESVNGRADIQAKHFCVLTTTETRAKIWSQ